MLNAVGRDIPEEILKATGKEVFQGVHHFDGHVYKKHGPETKCVINSEGSKLVENIHEVLVKCDGNQRYHNLCKFSWKST